MSVAPKLATYEDLFLLEESVLAEVIGGFVETSPAPLPRHSRVQRSIGRMVGGPYDDDDGYGGPGGWWIFLEVDIRLSKHDIVRPDISGWKRDRLINPDVRPIDIVPDWVVEVISPSTASRDRVLKRKLYAQHGVSFYWLIDPEARTLEALALQNQTWVEVGSFGEEDEVAIAPFHEVTIPVGRLFFPQNIQST